MQQEIQGGWHGSEVDSSAEFRRVAAMFAFCAGYFPELVEDQMDEERLDPLDRAEDLRDRLSTPLAKAWGACPDDAALERAAWMASTVASAYVLALKSWDRKLEADQDTGRAAIREGEDSPRLRPLADTVTAMEGVGAVAAALGVLGQELAAGVPPEEGKQRVKELLDAPRKIFTGERGLRLRQLPPGAYALTYADVTGRIEAAALALRGEREAAKSAFGGIRKGQALRLAQVVLARRETGALVTGEGALGSWLHGAVEEVASEGVSADYLASLVVGAWRVSCDARDILDFLVRHAAGIRSFRLYELSAGKGAGDFPGVPSWWGKPETASRLKSVADACCAALGDVNAAKSGGFVSNLPTPTRILAWGAVEILDSLRPQGNEAEIYPELVETISGVISAVVTDDVNRNYKIPSDAAKEAAEAWRSGTVKADSLARATDEWRMHQLAWRKGARLSVD